MGKGSRGGRYASTTSSATSTQVTPPTPQPQNQQIQNQVPTAQNTPVKPDVLKTLQSMSDSQLAQMVKDSKGIKMPNFLADAHDLTQEVVYNLGMNDKPQVLDDADFDKYLRDNNIPTSNILARSVDDITYKNKGNANITLKATDVIDMLKYSKLNYIGGKHGGQFYGAGTYFDMNGGHNTGYGYLTTTAVLNPAKAKIIDKYTLHQKANAFAAKHPKFVKQVGAIRNSNLSIYALAMGYNVITNDPNYPGYHNVIDRSVLVMRKSNK